MLLVLLAISTQTVALHLKDSTSTSPQDACKALATTHQLEFMDGDPTWNGAPRGCVHYHHTGHKGTSDDTIVWVDKCFNQPNICGTNNCNGCCVLTDGDGAQVHSLAKCQGNDAVVKTVVQVVDEVFGDVMGNPIVFTVDQSGSMGSAAASTSLMAKMHVHLRNTISQLQPDTKFYVVAYSNAIGTWTSDGNADQSTNADNALNFINGVGAGAFTGSGGTTNSQGALESSYSTLPDTVGPESRIYFLSDGSPNSSPDQILAKMPTWDGGRGIPVNAICFGTCNGVLKSFMKGVPQHGGVFTHVIH